jgi:predicted aspartyl protease
MNRLRLSRQAEAIVKSLIDSQDSERAGSIAAVDPETGEAFFGETEVQAAKEGRRVKNDPKAVFFFVRVGYPSVHVLKRMNLQGHIRERYFPVVQSYVQNRCLHIASSLPEDMRPLDLIVDTGFSGGLTLDTEVIQNIDSDYLGDGTVTLAGGIVQSVSLYVSDVFVNDLELTEIEIFEMKEEYLLGMALMRAMCKRLIFRFDNEEVIFEN